MTLFCQLNRKNLRFMIQFGFAMSKRANDHC